MIGIGLGAQAQFAHLGSQVEGPGTRDQGSGFKNSNIEDGNRCCRGVGQNM